MAQSPAPPSLQAWLDGFLKSRGLAAPDARPLHRYQVSQAELAGLKELLRDSWEASAADPGQRTLWAAAFSLCAAETYRREHDGEPLSWSTVPLEESLGCTLTEEERGELGAGGLAWWKRKLRSREGSPDVPGTLRLEGGLPWKPLESHLERLDAALRHILQRYHPLVGGGRTISELLTDSAHDLPQAVLQLDGRWQLAGVVGQLMQLADQQPLADAPDPAAYLDQHLPGWETAFPFPADEPRARALLAGWLGEAVARAQRLKDAPGQPRPSGCEHWVTGAATAHWRLQARISLPAEETISIDPRSLVSTRLVLAVYEGERLLELVGVLHAHAVEDGIKVQYPDWPLTVVRRRVQEPLSLRLLENGRCIHAVPLPDSALELTGQPLVLETGDEPRRVLATASRALAAPAVMIRVPPGARHDAGDALFTEDDGASWIEARTDLTVTQGEEVYRIDLNRADAYPGPLVSLSGPRALFESVPGVVFLGWPTLDVPEGSPHAKDPLAVFVDGKPLRKEPPLPGAFHLSVRTTAGDTLLRQHIGILPADFSLSLTPPAGDQPARLLVSGGQAIPWRLEADGLTAAGEGAGAVPVKPDGSPPAWLSLALKAPRTPGPVTLSLPYPTPGARLFDEANRDSKSRELTLQELQGARILLCASAGGQDFHLQLDLLSSAGSGLRHHHLIRVGDTPVAIALGGYLAQIEQMLGAVDDPDAYVRLSVETNHPLLRINIRRFGALLEGSGPGRLRVCDIDGHTLPAAAGVEAVRLDGALRTRVHLAEDADGGIPVPEALQQEGTWLIHPATAGIGFRPELHLGATPGVAASLLQPIAAAEAMDRELRAMAADLDHSGWQQLDELRRDFAHLPLATFQGWRSLARHPDALGVALLRLSVDERFCERIHDELAVLWEYIPVDVWVRAFATFRAWTGQRGLPQALLDSYITNRTLLLRAVVPGLDFIVDYLTSGQKGSLKKPPIELVLPYHYQELRRTHQANDRWPTELATALSGWLERQKLPRTIRKLSNTAYSDAVTYLPIFMAHVTAGKASLSVLPGDSAYVKLIIRKISEFDRGWYLYVHSVLVSYLLAGDA